MIIRRYSCVFHMGELFAVSFLTIKHGWRGWRRQNRENRGRRLERREIRIVACPQYGAIWWREGPTVKLIRALLWRWLGEIGVSKTATADHHHHCCMYYKGLVHLPFLTFFAQDSPSTTVCGNPSSLSVSMYPSGSYWLTEQPKANHHPI